MEQIACKECTSPYCHGCNMYRLERMLMSGKLDALMGENRTIKMDANVRPVVFCGDCTRYFGKENGGYTAGYCKRTYICVSPFDFCSRGEKRGESDV